VFSGTLQFYFAFESSHLRKRKKDRNKHNGREEKNNIQKKETKTTSITTFFKCPIGIYKSSR